MWYSDPANVVMFGRWLFNTWNLSASRLQAFYENPAFYQDAWEEFNETRLTDRVSMKETIREHYAESER